MASTLGSRMRFGEFTLDLRTGELFSSGPTVTLSHQTLQLLVTLIGCRGELVTRDELRRRLWAGDTFVDFEPSLNAAVRRLRDALGDSADTPRFIETLPRRGYRFIAPVAVVEQDVSDGDDEVPAAEPAERPPDARPAGRLARRWQPRPVIIVALALATAGVVLSLRRSPPAPEPTALAGRLTSVGTVRLASLERDGRRLAYVRAEGTGESLWIRESAAGSERALLAAADGTFRSVTFGPDQFVYYSLFVPDSTHVSLYRVPTTGGDPQMVGHAKGRVAFSPDGTRAASVYTASLGRSESHVLIEDLATRASRVLAVLQPPSHFPNLKPAWSPDGTRVAVAAVDEAEQLVLAMIEVGSGPERARRPLALAQVADLLWVSADELVVAGRERRGLSQRLWALTLSSMRLRPLTDEMSDYELAGVQQGTGTVVAVRRQRVRSVWVGDANGAGGSRQVAMDSGSIDALDGLAFTPDGRIVYEAMDAANVDLYSARLEDGIRRRLTTDPAADFHPAVSRDGTTIAFVSERGGTRGIWMMAADGSSPRRLTSDADDWPSFSHDGRWVAFQRGRHDNTPATIWRVSVETGDASRVGPTEVIRPVFSPDGTAVAHYWMTPDRWTIAITPLQARLPTRTLPLTKTHTGRTLRWSRDGRALAFLDSSGGTSNVWLQSVDGGPPRALTHETEGRMTTFDWPGEGSVVVWTRMTEVGDVVSLPIGRAPGF
jgi:Tol biopolymer transport system component/DNA-binding winged helix-turn-helix (wHTH) protein